MLDTARPYSEIVLERTRSNGGAWKERAYVHTPDGVGLQISESEEGQTRHIYTDAQGSTRLITDEAGNVLQTLDYDAFGNEQTSGPTRHRYTGESFDSATGLYHLRARDYDPSTGRFISMDEHPGSRTIPLTLNKYLYGNADPVNHVDPSGNFTISGAISGISATISMMTAFSIGWESGSIINRVRAGESLISSANIKSMASIGLALIPAKYLAKISDLAGVARHFEAIGMKVKIYDKSQTGFMAIYHLVQRMRQRGITPKEALEALANGKIYRDVNTGAIARVLGGRGEGGVKIIIDKGVIVTACKSKLTNKFVEF